MGCLMCCLAVHAAADTLQHPCMLGWRDASCLPHLQHCCAHGTAEGEGGGCANAEGAGSGGDAGHRRLSGTRGPFGGHRALRCARSGLRAAQQDPPPAAADSRRVRGRCAPDCTGYLLVLPRRLMSCDMPAIQDVFLRCAALCNGMHSLQACGTTGDAIAPLLQYDCCRPDKVDWKPLQALHIGLERRSSWQRLHLVMAAQALLLSSLPWD